MLMTLYPQHPRTTIQCPMQEKIDCIRSNLVAHAQMWQAVFFCLKEDPSSSK